MVGRFRAAFISALWTRDEAHRHFVALFEAAAAITQTGGARCECAIKLVTEMAHLPTCEGAR